MNYRLSQYVKSKGQHMPDNLWMYKAGGDRDHLCPFCEEHNASFPIIHFPVFGTTQHATFTSTYACWNCCEDIIAMEHDLAGPPIRGSVFDTVEDTSAARIELFVQYGQFDSSVDLHYQHLDAGPYPNSRTCYMCKNITVNYALIQSPVRGDANNLSGGLVRVCDTCQAFAKAEYGFVFKSQTPMAALKACVVEKCASCESTYLIDPHEAEYRGSYRINSMGRHLCPKCAYKHLVDLTDAYNWGYSRNRLIYETGTPSQRYYPHTCEYCKDSFLVDGTLDEKVLLSQHMSKSRRIMCLECFDGIEGGPIEVISVSGTTICFYEVSRNRTKVVIKPRTGKRIEYVTDTKLSDLVVLLMAKYTRKIVM